MTDVFGHPWLGGLFGDQAVADQIGAKTTLTHMLAIEAAYARALGSAGMIDPDLGNAAATAIAEFRPDITDLKDGTARDGLAVPALVRALKAALPDELHTAIHTGLTSQDVIDTALVLCLKPVTQILADRLQTLSVRLDDLDARFGDAPLKGRTRMQAAIDITVRDRVRTWRRPIANHLNGLTLLAPRLLVLQLGGAVGDRAPWGEAAAQVAAAMATELGLGDAPGSWHVQRETLTEFADWQSRVTGTLGKMGQDIALMAQQGLDEIALSGGGASSAMPHKSNPIRAELLVTLARFNATQLPGMHHALVHEQERSGIAWSLEWMILPQMVLATGSALNSALQLCESITAMGTGSR